jgi:hypothetical protein
MNTEEKKELELLREEVNRIREEVDRLTKMNVSLAAGSESLLKRNMDFTRVAWNIVKRISREVKIAVKQLRWQVPVTCHLIRCHHVLERQI